MDHDHECIQPYGAVSYYWQYVHAACFCYSFGVFWITASSTSCIDVWLGTLWKSWVSVARKIGIQWTVFRERWCTRCEWYGYGLGSGCSFYATVCQSAAYGHHPGPHVVSCSKGFGMIHPLTDFSGLSLLATRTMTPTILTIRCPELVMLLIWAEVLSVWPSISCS